MEGVREQKLLVDEIDALKAELAQLRPASIAARQSAEQATAEVCVCSVVYHARANVSSR